MDEFSIPSTAIYGGNLARTFEYRTTGVHATPHLHWSFPLQEGATISCPVLVAENVVYVGDSAGFFSAIDARSGDLLWCFATDWTLDEEKNDDLDVREKKEIPGVTAFCLAGRLGYVASVYHTLYEVDLSNGQALRSWNGEALGIGPYEIEEILFSDHDDITLLLFSDQRIWFNGLWDWTFRLDPATGSIDRVLGGYPIMYRRPRGGSDAIYGFGYRLGDLPAPLPPYVVYLATNISEGSPLWYLHEEDGKGAYEDEGVLFRENVYADLYTMMDDLLYALYGLPSVLADGLADDDTPRHDELLALDPFTGVVQWRYPIPKSEDTASGDPLQLAATSPLIFLVTRQGVEAVDTHAHQRRWNWTSNRDERHVLIADGLLIVLDEAGQITALDAPTGQPRWNWQTEQPIDGWVSTIADATLYLAVGHTLCAFR